MRNNAKNEKKKKTFLCNAQNNMYKTEMQIFDERTSHKLQNAQIIQ